MTQATNLPEVFSFKDKQVRVNTDEQGNPWFVAKDVCEALDIKNHKDAVSKALDEDEVEKVYLIDSLGRNQDTMVINESGLYTLIMRSNKPQAKSFRKWVTSEVLPSIRKTGTYSTKKVKKEKSNSLASVERC